MLGVPSLVRTSVHPTKRSLITRSKGIPQYNMYLAFRPSEFWCQVHPLYIGQAPASTCILLRNFFVILRQSPPFLSLFFLCSAALGRNFLHNLFYVRQFLPAESPLHGEITCICTIHIHTLNIVSSNSGRSNNMASAISSSICRFSNSSSKVFNTSAHSILDLISAAFNV